MFSLRAFVLALCAAAPSVAQTYYVDAVGGDDANGGTSWDDAWRTLSRAGSSGTGLILVAPGLYDAALGEAFPIPLGTRTFRGVGGVAATVVDGGGNGILFDGGAWYDGGTLEGLTLRSATRGVDVYVDCFMDWCESDLTLRDCVLEGMGSHGVCAVVWTDWYDAYLDVVVERCVFRGCPTGIEVEAICDPNHPTYPATAYGDLRCSDSLFTRGGVGIVGSGLDLSNFVDMTIERCTFVGFWGTAVVAGQDADAGLRSCISWGNGADVQGAVGLSYCNTEHALHGGTGNISEDPLFFDPAGGDLRLRWDSPCVDTGSPGEPALPDLAGYVRPIYGDLDVVERADMGAYELATLHDAGEAHLGATVTLELWGPAGAPARVFWRRGEPVAPFSTPYGDWELGFPRHWFASATSAPGPPGTLPIDIPTDPGLVGSTFSFQSLTANALTNAASFTIVD